VQALCGISVAVAALAAPACAGVTEEARQLVDAMQLQPGMVVADVGAGDGEWTVALSAAVGQDGHVYATEIETDKVEELRQYLDDQKIENATVLLGNQTESGLSTNCCDAVLLRMVYHHFENPEAMRTSLHQALRPGGVLAIVDIVPQRHWRQLKGVPERGGHGIPLDDLVEELIVDGFELVSRHDDWNDDEDRYCAVFRTTNKAP
jgi:predicted methyltransferase